MLTRTIEPHIAVLCVSILALNLLDAFATLRHLEFGAQELNPFMSVLLRHGAREFLVVKHSLASLGVLGIALYPTQKAANVALAVLVPVYGALAVYQICLFYVM
jgi:hypothetical protein